MYVLSPSIYAADYMKLPEQIRTLEKMNIKRLHVDIMDGNFVPNLSFGPDFVRALRAVTQMELDVHLMVKDPERYIKELAEAGSDIITVHYEACEKVSEILDEIHSCGKKAGVVLKPETELNSLPDDLWEKADVFQIMTVQPGMKGQHFICPMLKKIEDAYEIIQKGSRSMDIEVDGDITIQHLQEVLKAGANVVVVGKALFHGCLEDNIKKYQLAGMTGSKKEPDVYQAG